MGDRQPPFADRTPTSQVIVSNLSFALHGTEAAAFFLMRFETPDGEIPEYVIPLGPREESELHATQALLERLLQILAGTSSAS